MTFSSRLPDILRTLTDMLAEPEVDLDRLLHNLTAAATEAVQSLTSISMTVTIGQYPFTVTAYTPAENTAVRSTLRLPLHTEKTNVDASLMLCSAVSGAFVDLAADLAYITEVDPSEIELDAHIPGLTEVATHDRESTETGFDALRAVDQAQGFLVARGHTLAEAASELNRRAQRHAGGLVGAAHDILTQSRGGTCDIDTRAT